MTAAKPNVPTKAIKSAVAGREREILRELGVQWTGSSKHIGCPYPDHEDQHPSWRWNQTKRRAHCTCTPSASIFDVVCKVKGIDFEAAKIWVAETIGRSDLIVEANKQYQRTDATSLLSPPTDNRDDTLPWAYLGHRLGIEPDQVPRPATKVVGVRSLEYFDPPRRRNGKPLHVGDFPAAALRLPPPPRLPFRTRLTAGRWRFLPASRQEAWKRLGPGQLQSASSSAPIGMRIAMVTVPPHGAERLPRGNSPSFITPRLPSQSPCPASRGTTSIGWTFCIAMALRPFAAASYRPNHMRRPADQRRMALPTMPRSPGWLIYRRLLTTVSASQPQGGSDVVLARWMNV